MMFRVLTLLAALAMLAACETAPGKGGANISGASSGSDAGASSGSDVSSGSGSDVSSGANVSSAGDAATTQSVTEQLVTIGDRVHFGFDSYELNLLSKEVLRRQAVFLADNPSVRITIEGHCDERGTREYNLALGESRAAAARDFLVAQGVNPNRIKTISYGKERPAAIGSTENAWKQNRRAVSVIN